MHMKDCQWNLTKARHCKGGGRMSQENLLVATLVRHDLRPRAVLAAAAAATTPFEDTTGSSSILESLFVVVDPIQQELKRLGKANHTDDSINTKTESPSHDISSEGIRQRKKATTTKISVKVESPKTTAQAWTIELEDDNDNTTVVHDDSYEMLLRHVDPLELFGGGLNPKVLQVAQVNAKLTLECYVRAANLKRALEHQLNHYVV
jgi:hypothetical protein